MQLIFGQLATELAKTGRFIKRTQKLTGEKFAQILIFSWLSNATYCDMAQTALSLGIKISPQAIEKRFTEESAQFLLAPLKKAFLQVVETGSTATALFCRFSSVIVADSTISCPLLMPPSIPPQLFESLTNVLSKSISS